MLELSAEKSAAVTERLGTEGIAWVTTLPPDGQPQSSPVWFWWDGQEFLVYAQPRSWKVRNIRASPKVSLHLNSDKRGGQVVTFEGTAHIGESDPRAHEAADYLAKYRVGIAGIGMTPRADGRGVFGGPAHHPDARPRLLITFTQFRRGACRAFGRLCAYPQRAPYRAGASPM